MIHRLLQLHTSEERAETVRRLLGIAEPAWWNESAASGGRVRFEALVEVGRDQALLDELDHVCAGDPASRLVVLAIEATLPKLEAPPPPPPPANGETARPAPSGRISREELHDDLAASARLTGAYVTMLVLAVSVVTVGLLRDSAAVVIGGMVLAPLLGPNIALAFAATVADGKLALQALRTGLFGLGLAGVLAIAVGAVFGVPVDLSGAIASHEILSRTDPHLLDLLLATAAGVAGVMSFTTAVAASLVGVMVAVALMPPLVVFGMCLGAGRWVDAEGALALLLTNIVCVDLAAVLTFLAQAVRPRDWWDVQRSRRIVRVVVLGLLVALAAVSVLLALGPHRRG